MAATIHRLAAVPDTAQDTSLDDWGAIIRGDLGRAVDGYIDAGRHLAAAKDEHPGEFVAWLRSGGVGIGPRHAQRLMRIASAVADIDATRRVALPVDSLALYELARLDQDDIIDAISAGEIEPGMTRGSARDLVRRRMLGEPEPAKPDDGPSHDAPEVRDILDETRAAIALLADEGKRAAPEKLVAVGNVLALARDALHYLERVEELARTRMLAGKGL